MFLKHPNANINQRTPISKFTPLQIAVKLDQLEIVKLLLDHDAVCADAKAGYDRSPLQVASIYGSARVVEYLLSIPGIDTYCKDSYEFTALQLAAFRENWKTVHLILEQQNGLTPTLSKTQGRFVKKEVIRRLLEHADFEDPNIKGLYSTGTMLHVALRGGDCELTELLLAKRNIDVNRRNRLDRTPLHYSVFNYHNDARELLLQHPDIKLDQEDYRGDKSLNLARSLGRNDIVDLLLPYGAKDDEVNHLKTIAQIISPTSATDIVIPQTTSFHPNNELYPHPWDDPIYDELIDGWDKDLIMEEDMSE